MSRKRLTTDERGVSRMFSYMLTIGIAMMLVTGLFVSGSALVENQQEETVRSQMSVVGERVAGSLEVADRLVRSPEETRELRLSRQLPSDLAGTTYTLSIDSDTVVVREAGDDLSVETAFKTQTAVSTTSLAGGDIVIKYDTTSEELVIENAA